MPAPKNPETETATPTDDTGYFAPYAEFAKTLRTWFIAYGIGAPVFVLSTEGVSKKVVSSGCARTIAYLFLAGVALQILQALLYKSAMWHQYVAELDSTHKKSIWYRASDGISNSFVLEIGCDLITLALFGAATFVLLNTLL